MAVKCSPFGPRPQFEDANGNPDSGYQLFFYAAGSSTKQNTYTSSTGLTGNANPIVLNSLGMTPYEVWFTDGLTYKVVLAPANDTDPPSSGVTLGDNLSGINDVTSSVDQWITSGLTPTYISATSFSFTGDQTTIFTAGRRVKTANSGGTVYGTILTSVFGAVTTVTLVGLSGSLDSGLSAVSYGILSADNTSIPNPVMGTPQATTSGTSKDFTIPSWAKMVRVNFVGVSTSGTDAYLIQLGDAGGIETTGYLGSGSVLTSAAQTATAYTTGFGIVSGSAANVIHGTVTLSLVDSSAFTWVASGSLGTSNSGGTFAVGGSKSTSAITTTVRITTTGGTDTFDAGAINILYS